MSQKYGVLLVGGGRSHQEGYSRDFAADPRCNLVGVTDEADVPEPRASWNRELADSLGVPLLPDLDAALKRSDVHITSVCVEFERRGPLAARCARAGKHVYVDKPIAANNEHADELVAAVRESGVKSQMFNMVRQNWAREARQMVDSGTLGNLVGMHCDLLFTKGPAGTADLSRPRKEKSSPERFTFVECKRELFTTCVYSIGVMRWIHQKPITRVYARTGNYFFREHQQNDVEDFVALSLEFEGGLTATVTGGRNGWLSHPGFGPVRIFLMGSRKSHLVDASALRLEVACDTPKWVPPAPNPNDPMGFWSSTTAAWGGTKKFEWQNVPTAAISDASYFVDCIEGDRESDMNAAESAKILRVMLAAYESAALSEPISLS